jgi:predicted DNA-binding protein with PD1-like motif
MIITQTREQRSFVGSMNPGADIVQGLVQICVDNSIFCAHFSGTGYLTNPELRSYNMSAQGFDAPVQTEGTFHVVSLHGNVSLQERQTVVRIHVVGTVHIGEEEPRLLSGELVGGEIVSLEFSLSTIDDIRLYRAEDDSTGLAPWLHMDMSSGLPNPHEQDRELPLLPTAPGAGNAAKSSSKMKGATVAATEIEISEGDWLDHPTLGTCRVLASDEDEHVTIELESGRRVELHLGLIQLTPSGTHVKGGNRFSVSIARRRR